MILSPRSLIVCTKKIYSILRAVYRWLSLGVTRDSCAIIEENMNKTSVEETYHGSGCSPFLIRSNSECGSSRSFHPAGMARNSPTV